MRVLVVDNYDSFTWNLVQALEVLGARCEVHLNDKIDVATAMARGSEPPDGILISPGPCTPNEAGISLALIEAASATIPILGVCLGHQAIAQAFGGKVVRAERILHGKTSPIEHDGRGIYEGLPQGFEATRYHSLLVERASLPPSLRVTSWTREGEIMGLAHVDRPVIGVQFHPESILTTRGVDLLRAWVAELRSRAGTL